MKQKKEVRSDVMGLWVILTLENVHGICPLIHEEMLEKFNGQCPQYPGHCPWIPWTLSTHSMDIVHTFHGHCPHIPWTLSTHSMDSMDIVLPMSMDSVENIHGFHGKMSRMSMESMDFLQTGPEKYL